MTDCSCRNDGPLEIRDLGAWIAKRFREEPGGASGQVSASMIPDGDYVLGTHDEEIEQLGLQHQVWQWPKASPQVGLRRLVDLGLLAPDRARAISAAFSACGSAPHTLVITRAVLESIAVRR